MMHNAVTTQTTINADRFVLRPPQVSDAGLVAMYLADATLARNMRSVPHPLPPGTVEALITRAQHPERTEDVWIMDGSAHGNAEVLGAITLRAMDRDQSEISGWVATAFENAGFATEAMKALVQANPQNSACFLAEAFQDNAVSARVLTNCGFEYLGDAEAFSVARKAMVPTWTYILKTTA